MKSPGLIKVLHLLVSLPVGGAEGMVADIATGLDPQQFQVMVACIGPPGPLGQELQRAGHPVFSLGLDIRRTPALKIVKAVRRLVRELRPDILHTHLYHPNLYGRLGALGLGLKGVVATIHNLYHRVKFHRCLLNSLLGRIFDYVLVFSPQVAKDVRRYDLVPSRRLRILSPGVRVGDLAGRQSPEEAKACLGVGGFCVGTVARLEEQKGLEFLLAATALVQGEIADLNVLLVGDGQRRDSLRQFARNLNLEGVVQFLGSRRDVPKLLRAMDIFVLSSLWEGIPLTLLEAMEAGLPVISTRVGRAAEVIRDGENGRLVPAGDAKALATAILELYRQPEWRRQWGQQARHTIVEHYSLDHFLRQFAEIYVELSGKAG